MYSQTPLYRHPLLWTPHYYGHPLKTDNSLLWTPTKTDTSLLRTVLFVPGKGL